MLERGKMALPVRRFKRVAEAFEKVASARVCESSGSEHSPETCADLSDLVNSFIERNNGVISDDDDEVNMEKEGGRDDFEGGYCSDSETKDLLKSLLKFDDDDDEVKKKKVRDEAERAYRFIGDRSTPDFKRRLMVQLREFGLDAGLCKSKWEKIGRLPSGNYEYVDVNIGRTRYIVEVLVAGEFKIARPTDRYASILNDLPQILVTKTEELKKIVRLMCRATKKSMKSTEMHLPPWRQYGYVQAKWFSSYKRTTNEVSTKRGPDSGENSREGMRSVGFSPLPASAYYCREIASKRGLRVGNLAAAINGTTTMLL
ncbi:hypothetical protein LguiA_015170 [Lonicera macranthoides]